MTDKEFDELMQANPEARIATDDQRLVTLEEFRRESVRQVAAAFGIPQRVFDAEPSEEEMQIAVIRWADAQDHPALKWLFHVPNGGHRDPATAGRMKAAGVRRGVPDLLLPWHVYAEDRIIIGLAIEMKRKPNKTTPEQLEWLSYLHHEGWRTEVCYSTQAAIDTIKAYLRMD